MYIRKKYSQFLLTQQAKMICHVFVTGTFIYYANLAAMENNGHGTKAIGMGNAFVAVADNAWAIDYNPAGLVQVRDFQCSVFLIPEQFGIPELRTTAISMIVPFAFASVGAKVEKFGFDLYTETEYGLACSVDFKQNFSMGISINIDRLDISRYGSTQKLILNSGVLIQVIRNIKIGFNFTNMARASIGKLGERMPQECALGVCWFPVDDLILSLELEKDIRYQPSIKAGIEKRVFNVIALRFGIANNPDKYSVGIALKYSAVEFGYAGYSHCDLGWTNQIDLSFVLAK